MAYWKQERANERMLFSLLWAACQTAGPSTFCTRSSFFSPLSPTNVSVAEPGSVV